MNKKENIDYLIVSFRIRLNIAGLYSPSWSGWTWSGERSSQHLATPNLLPWMQKTIGVELADGDPTPGLLQHGFDPMLW